MNGAESLVRTLLTSGVDTCFANPGTSELHFVSALDRVPGMRCMLTLFEGVATGCADGYARITGKPAATLLHCGPGLANGLANLHNARRASSPVVNIVGDQATQHRPLDSNLTADTEGWARPVSAWVRTAATSETVGSDAAVAVQAARTFPGQIATLILPADTAWNQGGIVADPLPLAPAPAPPPHTIRQIAELLRRGEPCMLFLSRKAVLERGLNAAYRIAEATGAQLMAQQANPCLARGRGRPPVECLPYAMHQAAAALAGVRHLVLAGAVSPVAVFAYPNRPGSLTGPDTTVHVLARLDQDPVQALEALADEIGAPNVSLPDPPPPPQSASGALTSAAVGQTLAALMPEHAIVADEGVTFRGGVFVQTRNAPPHHWMQNPGSSIGMGLPLATGAAVAAPGRRAIVLQADGSAMYTIQALWTQARERLDVTTLLLANRKYAILLDELANVGAQAGPASKLLTDIGDPTLNWIKIANGMGVDAAAAHNCEQLAEHLRYSFHTPGPFLIELVL